MQCDRPEIFPASRQMRDSQPLYSHLIGNEWVDSAGPPPPVTAPATRRRFAWVAGGGALEVDAAVQAARAALAGEAGFPAGTLNIVTGLGEVAGAALTAWCRPRVGWWL